ncbi:hypothetical protein COS50_02390 [Candidatus Roizmanbacteria bacterium CG03_land_8_20_14_0_80_35_26]|uniref:DNA-binding protein n=2 Tax=Candidatus Roizmaniibacteriota TaxID=1752723 RepID=A0A2M7BWU6_9BACT|nr:MAG: hypothetical protein COS50_02390 [Candidatus Roizmanbacteria bacterium CG03_land_8_20_14_0_80_35_26]PJC32834.1 MAG: hypothetical protein CO049_01765 [Candidatus Roizmanbacteria bacterium CG_4_9_14_0_2_um_filter_36_12]PJC80139.1 MAG: hypothetical protein CO008_02750 [Candidatus Roizmanbacteria bacterium CG_4_8_14_3_um_filter_36_12]
MDQNQNQKPKISGQILKLKGKTIFFDIYEAKNKSQYLKITESRFDKETKQSRRSSIFLFKEDIEGFKNELNKIILE